MKNTKDHKEFNGVKIFSELSGRTKNALSYKNIYCVEQLSFLSWNKIQLMEGLGNKSLRDINELLYWYRANQLQCIYGKKENKN